MKQSQRIGQIAKSAIHEMTRLSKQYEDVAFLSWAKPVSGTPEHIRAAASRAILEGKADGYSQSEGLPALREAIARKLKRDNGINANAGEIIVTTGAVEGLMASVLSAIDPGDEVILPTPTYSTHITQVRLASGVPVLVPLPEDRDFQPDLQQIEDAVTDKTRALMYCSPSNPTGTVFSEATLRGLADIARRHDLTVITDEAYEYFVFDGAAHFSIASIPEMKDYVISNYTFTKTYAMTGWRTGYLHASAERIAGIKKAHIPLTICAPAVSQYASLAALQGSQACIETFRNGYLRSRDMMCERLDRLPQYFSYVRPEGSYLMFPRVLQTGGDNSLQFCKRLLSEAKVSTTPGAAFGPTGEGHVRMSFCVPEETVNKAFDRIEAFFS